MRVPGAVVGAQPLLVQSRKTNFAKRRSVDRSLSVTINRWNKALATKKLTEKAHW
jgi:hypothetical protein